MGSYLIFPILYGLIFGTLILLAWMYRSIMDKLDASHGEKFCKDDSLFYLGRKKRQTPEMKVNEARMYKRLAREKMEKENA